MGDDILENGDELTEEERAIVNEEEDTELEAEETEVEETEEAEESEVEETETETDEQIAASKDEPKVPQSRVDEIVSEKKEAQHKLDLLKTDPDEYFRRYPDERSEPAPAKHDGHDSDVGNLIVTGGEHDGKTIREVLTIDPAEGNLMLAKYYDDQRTALSEAKATEDRRLSESQTEINIFSDSIAAELFEKKANGLDDKEVLKVNEVIDATLKFMQDTGRGGGVIADAHYLMTRDNATKKARTDGAQALADKITKSAVASVSSNRDSGIETGYVADMALLPEQLAEKIDGMSDSKVVKYLKDAPKEMRDKFPHLPWD